MFVLVPWCVRHTGRGAAWSSKCGGEAIESSDGATSPRDVGAIETTVGDPFVESLAEHAWLCIGVQRADVPVNGFLLEFGLSRRTGMYRIRS